MDAISFDSQGDVRARIDQQGSSQFSILSSHEGDGGHGVSRQRFQFAYREIFFTELDVVHSGAGRFGDFFEELPTV